MPSEIDALTAVRNRLMIRRDKHQKLANAFEEQIKNLDRVRTVLSDDDDLDVLATSEGGSTADSERRVPITKLIDRFISETGKVEFQAVEPFNFIKANGFPHAAYGSVYETLTRRVKAGKLAKSEDDPNFRVVEKPAD